MRGRPATRRRRLIWASWWTNLGPGSWKTREIVRCVEATVDDYQRWKRWAA